MSPLPSGINQPFDSSQGVKRPTKIEASNGALPPIPGGTEGESSGEVCLVPGVLGVFGAYVELFVSTPFRAEMFTLNAKNNNQFQTNRGEIQIAKGLVGFEINFIDKFTYLSAYTGVQANATGAHTSQQFQINAGLRLSARYRVIDVDNGLNGICMQMCLYSGPN